MSSRLPCSMSEVPPTEVEMDRSVAPAAHLLAGLLQEQGEKTERQAETRFQSLLGRSEEHTSELESLMRISYAALSTYKKQHHHTLHRKHTTQFIQQRTKH